MCMLVEFHGQFVYILVRIEFPSNQALKEQVDENRPITTYSSNSNVNVINSSRDSPKHFDEVHLTNELICVHSHH
jgi:hypothetical protein